MRKAGESTMREYHPAVEEVERMLRRPPSPDEAPAIVRHLSKDLLLSRPEIQWSQADPGADPGEGRGTSGNRLALVDSMVG
jgi:hypothetical protein